MSMYSGPTIVAYCNMAIYILAILNALSFFVFVFHRSVVIVAKLQNCRVSSSRFFIDDDFVSIHSHNVLN